MTKAQQWNLNNIEKRRLSSRMSKRRLRALRGREKYSPSPQAIENRKRYDRAYSRKRYLLGLASQTSVKLFWLDAPRTETGETMYDVVDSGALSPLEILMAKEAA